MPRLENGIFLLPEWGCLRRCRTWKQNKSETKHEIVSLFCGKLNQIYFVSWIGLKAGGQNFTARRVRSRSVSEITVERPSTLPSSTTLNCSSLDGQPGSSNMKKILVFGMWFHQTQLFRLLSYIARCSSPNERKERLMKEQTSEMHDACDDLSRYSGFLYGNAPTPLKAFRWNFSFSLFFAFNKCTACGFESFSCVTLEREWSRSW